MSHVKYHLFAQFLSDEVAQFTLLLMGTADTQQIFMEVPCILIFTALCSSEGEKTKKLLQSLLSTENVSINAEDVVEPSKVSKAVESVAVPKDKFEDTIAPSPPKYHSRISRFD